MWKLTCEGDQMRAAKVRITLGVGKFLFSSRHKLS